VKGAGKALKPLADEKTQGGMPFGAGVQIGWDPTKQDFTILGGVQGHF